MSNTQYPVPNTQLPEPFRTEFEETWRDFTTACSDAGVSAPERSTILADKVFPFSEFVRRSVIRSPGILENLVNSGDLMGTYDDGHLRQKVETELSARSDSDVSEAMRRVRRREMIRIAWRDLAGLSDLAETMRDLTDLAEACLDGALERLFPVLCAELGTPFGRDGSTQYLAVIGMGKLGAGELNVSSDIDLIFAYPTRGETQGGPKTVSTDEFFTRLCRRLIKLIGETTVDGFVFRIDTRLRPDGDNGPLVMSFDSMVDYYQVKGREWERYAWIKARAVAGDRLAGRDLIRRLNPFIYRRYLDYGTFASLRDMKENIAREVRRKSLQDNIKLGAGGIREIEFFGQIFQLLRGGVVPALQERRIETVLEILVAEGYIHKETCLGLQTAYRVLRMTEHRLQEYSDQQTHMLPSKHLARHRLALSMGFEDWEPFLSHISLHRSMVHHCFNELLQSPEEESPSETGSPLEPALSSVWQDTMDDADAESTLAAAGYTDTGEAMRLMDHLRGHSQTRAMTPEGRSRLDRLVPILLREIGSCDNSGLVLNRILDLIQAVERRTTYLSLLLESSTARAHLVRLSASSPWIASFLAKYPALLDELLDTRTLYAPPARNDLEKELRLYLERLSEPDLELQMEALCLFKQVNVLRVAAADITGVLPLMRVSDHLSDIAETVLNEVLFLSWDYLVQKHGTPTAFIGDTPCDRGFVMIAYGKLGGLELGYGSDLDLVFLHSGAGRGTAGSDNPIDDTTFFARVGQRVLHIMSARTALGFLYEIDMRLRPSGSSGILVSHADAFLNYQVEEAWTWEHQALLRARAIAGDPQMVERFNLVRKEVLCQVRDPETLRREVADMRERLRKERDDSVGDQFDIKEGRGGIIDIEFLVQFLILRHAHRYPELTKWSDNVRQIRTLAACGILDWDTASFLRTAYLTFRSKIHRLNLQEQPARVPEDQFSPLGKGVAKIWKRHLGD